MYNGQRGFELRDSIAEVSLSNKRICAIKCVHHLTWMKGFAGLSSSKDKSIRRSVGSHDHIARE